MADQERFAGGIDTFWGEHFDVVHGLYVLDLGEETVNDAEVTSSDMNDARDGSGVRVPRSLASSKAASRYVKTAVSSSALSARCSCAKPTLL